MMVSFVWLVASIGCLFQVGYATQTNYTISGSGLLGSAVEYNPPVGDPNGWIVTKDGIMTTAAGATATFSLHAIGVYAFTNASAGASYTFQVDPYPAKSNAETGPKFVLERPNIQLGPQTLTITNLVAGQPLTILHVDYVDCVNDEAADCFYVPIYDVRDQGKLDYLAGPVAGGVIGGVVLIVGVILFIYHRRRVARRKAREASHRPLDFSAMQKPAPSAMSQQRDLEAQHARPVSYGNKGGVSSPASDGSSTSGDDDLKLDDNVLAFTNADIAKITAGGSKASPTSTKESAWSVPGPQRPSPSRQNPKRSSLTWSISSYSDASSR